MNLRLTILLLAASLLHADSLSDLKGTLVRLNGQEPVKATVDYQLWRKQGDNKEPRITQGKATTFVEDGPQGLKMSWSRSLIQTAAEKARVHAKNPEKPDATRHAIEALKAIQMMEYFNASGEVLHTLEQCQLASEKTETWQDKTVKVLSFKFAPKLSKQDQKYVKEMDATAKVWIGVDGVPVALETQTRKKGRALLVISFEEKEKESFQFTRIGDRLFVINHTRESSGSGGRESNQSKIIVTINPA